MKKMMLIMLAAVFQVAQMPHMAVAANTVEPWMTSEVTAKAAMAFDVYAGKKMTASEFLKGFENKMSPEMYTKLSKRAANSKVPFEIQRDINNKISIVFDAKSFTIEAVDAINGEFKFNGRNVKMNFEKMEDTLQKINDALKYQRKTSKFEHMMSLVLPSAQAGFLTNEDGSTNWSSILIAGGLLGLVVGGMWSANSRSNQYEALANQCGLNGQYAGGNPYRFTKAVDNLNNGWGSWNPFNLFFSNNDKQYATQCAQQAKVQMNQNYVATQNPGQGVFPRISQQLTPTRYDAVGRSGPRVMEQVNFRGRQATVPAPAVNVPVDLSGGGQQ